MAKTINLRQAQTLEGFEREAAYGCLDVIATLQIDNLLDKRMDDQDRRAMNFYLGVQAPAFAMMIRGTRVDKIEHEILAEDLKKEAASLLKQLQNHELIKPVWDKTELRTAKNGGVCRKATTKTGQHKWPKEGEDKDKKCLNCGLGRLKIRPFMPSSDDDLKHLFYDLWGFDPVYDKDYKITTSKEARLQLRNRAKKTKRDSVYIPPLELIDTWADIQKQSEFMQFRSNDGRFHSAFNVAVASTSRWTSNKDHFGRGRNAQNVTEKHRHIFVADPGYELCYMDLKQAESKCISFIAGDEKYIQAHEEGDTHTFVCRLVWPEGIGEQIWTGDLKEDRKLAESACPTWDNRPGHDFRFQSKAVQHGSNLGLSPFGLHMQKKIPLHAAVEAQRRYFRAFPGIAEYQRMVREEVENQKPLVTPFNIKFKMFGRPWDEHTYKEGLAVRPQSMVGHIVSIGISRIWNELPEIQLLMQVHDAILFQFPKGHYDLVYRAQNLMKIPVSVTGCDNKTRVMTIGVDAAVGHNWGHKSDKNPEGVAAISFKSETEWVIK